MISGEIKIDWIFWRNGKDFDRKKVPKIGAIRAAVQHWECMFRAITREKAQDRLI